ncbi:hypothetical protein Hanom_Chr14g01275331 [Helianthus anomalus]
MSFSLNRVLFLRSPKINLPLCLAHMSSGLSNLRRSTVTSTLCVSGIC